MATTTKPTSLTKVKVSETLVEYRSHGKVWVKVHPDETGHWVLDDKIDGTKRTSRSTPALSHYLDVVDAHIRVDHGIEVK